MTITLDATFARHTTARELQARLAPWSAPPHDGVLVLQSRGSQWLIDLNHNGYQRLERCADPERHLLTGTWTHYTELGFDPSNGVLVIHPVKGPALRTNVLLADAPTPVSRRGVPPPAGQSPRPARLRSERTSWHKSALQSC